MESGTFKINQAIDYSLDGGTTWITLAANTNTPTLNQGDKILWRKQSNSGGRFYSTGRFDAYGNTMSILYGDDFIGKTTFPIDNSSYIMYNLFSSLKIVNAKNLILPATTLAYTCYQSMFNGCTTLITAPELPATTVVGACYSLMFFGCRSLTEAPVLPAKTLYVANWGSYAGMFSGCTNLNNITMLATTIPDGSLNGWVEGVAATGTFTKAASMTTLPTGASGIPSGWTVVDA